MIYTIVALSALLVLFVILFVVYLRRTQNLEKSALEEEWLFYVESNDLDDTGVVTIKHSDARQDEFTLRVNAITSSATAFTNIPYHKAIRVGNLKQLSHIFNASTKNKLTFNESTTIQHTLDYINDNELPEKPFIDQQPNCSLSLTGVNFSPTVTNHVIHTHTIVKMVKIQMVGDDDVKITFRVLGDEKRPPEGTYEHMALTIDDFWSWVAIICASVIVVATAGAALSVVLPAAAAAGGVAAGAAAAAAAASAAASAAGGAATAVAVAGFVGSVATIGKEAEYISN